MPSDTPRPSDLDAWLRRADAALTALRPQPRFSHVGRVERVGDGVATVADLPRCRLSERLIFDGGVEGIALSVHADRIGVALLGPDSHIRAGSPVRATGDIIRVPVGPALLGRVVDPTGRPLDGRGPIRAERHDPIERPSPAIVDRELVTTPLQTGITVVDAMIPIGRGQRELLIGDRKTGKTSLALDTILNQARTDVISVYAAIGQKASSVARVIEAVRTHGAPERTIIVVAGPETPPALQWIAPYAACSIAEYFRDRGQDALLVLDDLTKHANTYRELSLLLRRPPAREAYPGDVFYLHSRLLERAAHLSAALGGGSLTAIPIAETQAGNLTAFIPTNLISITDGQIYLEARLFNEGQKPAVNVGLSVSRVGGKTQAPALRKLAERLKLDYAQFLELETFTRFGAMVDERTRARIEHGRRIRAILRQRELSPLPLAAEVALLAALEAGVLDSVPEERIEALGPVLSDTLAKAAPRAAARVNETGELSDGDRAELVSAVSAALAHEGTASDSRAPGA
ncbi:MAG: F0F1 ATP synthase subunit alpha [Alphaproteobacteria bacterium]|nr:MAG: F0F1 ATP synthase subunit alpha [Alphaproteobacteria bacterium]